MKKILNEDSSSCISSGNDFPADISYDIDTTMLIVKILKYMMIFGRHIRSTGDKIIRYE